MDSKELGQFKKRGLSSKSGNLSHNTAAQPKIIN